jgi:tetratricopeptide (TPR) repeat protein
MQALQEAVAQHLVGCDPRVVEAHAGRAQIHAALGQFDDAEACWREVVRLQPELPAAHNNLGSTLHLLRRDDEAAACFRTALQLDPNYAEACNNLGTTLCALDQMVEGEALLRRAIALRPDYARAHANLGAALRDQLRIGPAETCFRTALQHAPDLPEAHLHLANVLLLTGRLTEAWPDFEWRPSGMKPAPAGLPTWRGEPVEQRTLLLRAQEGYGDTIQFCRYAELLAPNTRVVLQVQRSLVRLLRGLTGGVEVVSTDGPLPRCDLYCDLLSLPHIFGTTFETIPTPRPYLHPDPVAVAAWRQRLAALPGLRVGLVWAGNPDYSSDRRRSIDPDRLAALAGVPGIAFVSLQAQGGSGNARLPNGLTLYDPSAELRDFADTAALIAALDLVIGVDTAVVHLAGAMGKPVWLLNRFSPCWRWLLERDDSPWYPSLRQFRQPQPGDWGSVLAAVREALHDLPDRQGSSIEAAFRDGLEHDKAARLVEAERCYRDVLRTWPEHHASLHQLGVIAMKHHQPDAAIELFSRALRQAPDDAGCLNNLGNALRNAGARAEAVICYRESLQLQPNSCMTLCNIGNVSRELGDFAAAEAAFREALVVEPASADAAFALGYVFLSMGRLAEGWTDFAFRRQLSSYRYPGISRGIEWRGEPLGDRTLLLYSDEGFGDAIQFARYIKLLPAGSNIVVEVQQQLLRVFAGIPGVSRVVATGDALPPFDVHCSLIDLPRLFGTTLTTIPCDVPYLQADPAIVLRWHQRLVHLKEIRVGLVWAGNPENTADHMRSIPLDQLVPLFSALPEVSFVSLQKGPGYEQILKLNDPTLLHDWNYELSDFAETAGLIEALDLVIAVDTAVVHLAGALGKPVWLMNRFATCWRWLHGRTDSPWYPTLRVFRQIHEDDWSGVLAEVESALWDFVAAF